MMLFTKVVLSTSIALTLTKLTEGLDGTYQIRHPHDDWTSERQLSPLTTLTVFLERVRCRKKLRACQRVTNGKTPPLDAWEARISSLSGGSSTSHLVQALQDAIANARSVDMTAITNALNTPIANAADKRAHLQEARTIKAEAEAIWKAASTSSVEDAPKLIEKMQPVLSGTSILAQNVFGQLLEMIFKAVGALVKAYLSCAAILCCGEDPPINFPEDCNTFCVIFSALPLSPLIILGGLYVLIILFLFWLVPPGRIPMGSSIGGTCSDSLLSCQYDSLLFAIMPTAIDLAEKLG